MRMRFFESDEKSEEGRKYRKFGLLEVFEGFRFEF